MKKIASAILLASLLIGMLTLAFDIQPVRSELGLPDPPAVEWSKKYGGITGKAESVQQTSDGGYVFAGNEASGFWLVKTDTYGDMEWNKTYSRSDYDYAHSVQQTSDGGYIVAGNTRADPVLDYNDGWVVKTDSNGDMEWNKTYGGDRWDWIELGQQTSDGGYIFVGTKNEFIPMDQIWLLKTDENGTQQWEKTFGGDGWNDFGESVQQTNDGGYIIAGRKQIAVNNWDFWLIKTDENGNQQWAQTFGGPGSDAAYSVLQTIDGGYMVAGSTSVGALLVKTDAYGSMEWNKTYSGGGAYCIRQTGDGGYIFAGGWLVRIDENGSLVWSKSYDISAKSVWQTSDGGYIVAGESGGAWLIKLGPEPKTWTVDDDGPADFSSIQEAINSPQVMDGDIIYVYDGTYYENVLVNKTVSLIGEDGKSIIDGLRKGHTVAIEADNVILTGFTITNSSLIRTPFEGPYSGLYVTSDSCNVDRNNVTNNYYGIWPYNSSNNIISENNIANNELGINLDDSSNNTISGNHITTNNWSGVQLDDSSNNTIAENNITNNQVRGVELWDSSNNSISGNVIANSTHIGILLERSSNNIIFRNNITNSERGIELNESSNNSLSENILNDNRFNFGVHSWGLLSHYIQSIDVSNLVNGKPVYYLLNQKDLLINPSTHPQVGYLALINSTNITVQGITLSNNSQGLLLAYTSNSRVVDNKIVNNDDGIRLRQSSNNTLSRNNIANNNYGITGYYTNNTISQNEISYNSRMGIYLWWQSDSNVICDNNITDNGWVTGTIGSWAGVNLYYSSNNIFYHNNFIDNKMHVISEGSTNVWDDGYPSGGNYWSDYTGVDLDHDGIGDTEYVIDVNNQDNYPLMAPITVFNAGMWDGVSYNVDVISNSTVSDFIFSESEKLVSFDVTGPDGTTGFCRVTISNVLLGGPYVVLVNDYPPLTIDEWSNGTHTFLYFTYDHSTKPVEIIGTTVVPEFPTWISILAMFALIASFMVIYERRLRKTPTT